MSRKIIGHVFALITIIIWGVTFVASKNLLTVYSPFQTMLLRFAIAYVVLLLLNHKMKRPVLGEELRFFLLAMFGSTLYFVCENIALTYTLASNVSIILAAAPIITAVLAHLYSKEEKLHKGIWIGFVIAFTGVTLVVFNGTVILKLNPRGDILSLLAAVMWAIYSVLLRSSVSKYDSIYLTRKVIFYSILTTIPLVLIEGKPLPMKPLLEPKLYLSLLLLGVLGSGICYVMWNLATKWLGTITTNTYIYLNPFVTLIAAYFFLAEPISLMGIGGAVLIICGIVVSEMWRKTK